MTIIPQIRIDYQNIVDLFDIRIGTSTVAMTEAPCYIRIYVRVILHTNTATLSDELLSELRSINKVPVTTPVTALKESIALPIMVGDDS